MVEKTIKELFYLLNYKPDEVSEIVKKLLEYIGTEALKEMMEGMHLDKVNDITSYKDAKGHVDSDAMLKIVESASARVLVNYFADNKKNFDEKQKEIFLSFLLTSKLQRELEKNT